MYFVIVKILFENGCVQNLWCFEVQLEYQRYTGCPRKHKNPLFFVQKIPKVSNNMGYYSQKFSVLTQHIG